jgi:hypothetical protein
MFSLASEASLADDPGPPHDAEADRVAEPASLPEQVVGYHLAEAIVVAAANRFFDSMLMTGAGIRLVSLRLRRAPVMNAAGGAQSARASQR